MFVINRKELMKALLEIVKNDDDIYQILLSTFEEKLDVDSENDDEFESFVKSFDNEFNALLKVDWEKTKL